MDSGSNTSGLTGGGAVGGVGGPAVLEVSGTADGEATAGWVVTSEEGGVVDEVVWMPVV